MDEGKERSGEAISETEEGKHVRSQDHHCGGSS